ncbi:glycosyltransferase family 2 protein [Flavobacterium sp. CYK-55]|uniref:glycosyltransferase family 2 protein n=1 Tax=Flavobacterium sp. CYK-55 TaxID=2835529 RepID=UPI00293D2A60|nr:glycosyltransferase family 2 protein [Flavobacterium sp. CYK-55]
MKKEISIVMPCLNEAETLAVCIEKARDFLEKNQIQGEIIIADNGSQDGSQAIAIKCGAIVVETQKKGYGEALKAGFEKASGQFIIMADADNSYDFSALSAFVEKLRSGSDLVIGNRFKGGIQKNAMPFLHRYIGNPVLSFLGRLFFNSSIGDFHCGLRGFSAEAYQKLNLTTSGMEFASEMIVKAHLMNLKIIEVPTILYKDGRSRKPHLKTWSDGWRHLRFLLLYSPNWLFLIPGLLLMSIGLILSIALILSPIQLGKITLDVHTLLYASGFVISGFQFVVFYGLTKVFAVTQNLLPKSQRFNTVFKVINLERGLILGLFMTLFGVGLSMYGLSIWSEKSFGHLESSQTLRIVIPAVTLSILGLQTILFSFFFSILGLKDEKN